jgi:arginyl-tRNA synthetase
MQKLADQMPDGSAPLSVRAQFMGSAYALGAKDYEDAERAKKEIHELNKKVYTRFDKKVNELYDKGRVWSLEYFDEIYKRLGTKFERHYFESEVGEEGVKLVREFLKKGVFEESEGAIIFPGKKHGLHNRVFINSLGLPTYEAKDLGLAPTKHRDFAYDRSIIITAREQAEYFKVVLKALSLINHDLAEKTTHISHGLVRLPGGKMSSRTGNVITGVWLMDEAVARIQKEYQDMNHEVAEKVGLAAIKFALLKSAIGRDVEFDFDESISLNGASGPYLQYTYVRTQSVLTKNQKSKIKNQSSNSNLNNEEKEVLRKLVYFPEVVASAREKLSPNLLAEYLFELSQGFNLFYQKHKIADNPIRLELTQAVGQTLKNGLLLLGIETVARM